MAHDARTSVSEFIAALESLTVADLREIIAAAERISEAKRESEKRELVDEFRAKAEALGLKPDELFRASSGPRQRARSVRKSQPAPVRAVKFRNPETGETWSGRGRMPRWLKHAEGQGHARGEFAV